MTTNATRKGLLISPELCIGCRGCQTACKSWNQLPGQKTKNSGSMQNPPDISATAYNIIRYSEVPSDANPVRWLFVSRRCMHCDDAGCMKVCPAPGALYRTKDGAVDLDAEADLGGLGTLYAFKDAPRLYGMDENPAIPESVIFWHKVLKPMAVIGLGGVVAGALIHYAVIGPHKDDEEVK